MADNPNQSGNRRAPNTLAELGASVLPSSISRTLENASPKNTQRYQHLTQQIGRIQEDPLFQLGSDSPMLLTHPDAAKQYYSMKSRRASYMQQQEIMEEAAAGRANRMVGTGVNQSFNSGAINGEVARRLESTGAQQEALRIASRVDPEVLQRNLKRSEARMRRYGEEAAGIETVNRFGERDPASEERLQQLYGLREIELKRRTGMVGASQIHKLQGADPKSRMDELVRLVGKAENVLGDSNPDVRKLTTLSATDFRKREAEAADRLIKAFEKLSQISDTTSEEFKNLSKKRDEAEKQFKDVQAAKGMGGGSGGGGPSGWQLASSGFGAVGMAVQQIGVNQRLAQMSNAAGYANFQNDIYQTYKNANAGDVASLMRLPEFKKAIAFGHSLKNAASIAVGARGLGGLAQVGAGVAEAASTVNVASDLLNSSGAAMAAKAGGQDIIAGGATAAEAGYDLKRGVSAGQAALAGRQAYMAKATAVNEIGAEQLQGFRDYGVGLSLAAQGMGRRGESFLRSTATAAMLDRLSGARIAPEEFAQLAQQGVNSMGGGFNQEQIFGAKALERRGLGSAQENMARMSQLYAAGSNNPQEGLGKILEQAIPKGFDNSKLVGQLVQFSAQAAQSAGGAASGLNLTSAAAQLLTSGIGPTTVNKEAMLQHAADLQGAFKGIETNISTSYAGMTSVARAQRTLGVGGVSAVTAELLPTEALIALRDEADPNKRRQALVAQGLSPNTSTKQLEGQLNNRQMKELEGGSAGFYFNNLEQLAARMRKAGSYNNMSSTKQGIADQQELSQIAKLALGPDAVGEDLAKRFFGTGAKGTAGSAKGVFGGEGVGPLQKSMYDMRTQGAVQLSTAAAEAAKSLDPLIKSTGAIEKLAAAFKRVEETIGPVEKVAPRAAGKAMGGGGGFDTTQWDNAAKKLNTVLNKIIIRLDGSSGPTQRADMPQ
jgi:hypothetical protein